MTRVLLVDDQALLRAAFRVLIDAAPDVEVVGEAADGAEAVERCRELHPDVVLMDIRMPGVDGLEATRRIVADPALEATRVLVLTTFELDEHVLEALRAGASGFLGKGVEPAALLAAIRTVAAGGETLLSPAATRALVEYFLASATAGPGGQRLQALTEREREVVALVGLGLSNGDIAARLCVSPLTAKTHVNRAMSKLGARDRAQLVVLAYRSGLVRAGGSAAPGGRRALPACRVPRVAPVRSNACSVVSSTGAAAPRRLSTGPQHALARCRWSLLASSTTTNHAPADAGDPR